MKYLFMIYGDESVYASMNPADLAAELDAYNAFGAAASARATIVSGQQLQPTHTATTVRVRDSRTVTTDGPFAETREQFGGFYLIDCKNLDEAIELAAMIPGARYGSIEIRPIVEF